MTRIKILSRYDREKVLYLAEGAADVKAALTAARQAGANLSGADLNGQWTSAAVKDAAHQVSTKPPKSAPPTAGSPALRIGNWTAREPTTLQVSADGGDIVSNLRWRWDKTQAFGTGWNSINTCIPDCATGARMPVRAYILLSHPVDGQFTHLTESQGGSIGQLHFRPLRRSRN